MFKNKEGRVRSGWKIAFMMGASLTIIGIISSIVSFLVTVILISNGDFDYQLLTYTERGNQVMNLTYTLLSFLQEIVLIVTPIIAWKVIMRRPLSNMGLTSIKQHNKELIVGLLFGMISISIVFVLLILTGNARVVTWTPRFSIQQLIYLFLYIMVGFAEEIFGRGYIMSVLRQTRNVPVIIIISSIIFALLHGLNPGIGLLPCINLFLVGVLFAYMYIKSGNLWMCIGYHITWNYFQGYIYGFKVSGTDTVGIITTEFETSNLFNGGAFGPEGGLFVTLVILAGFLYVRMYYKNLDYDFIASEPTSELIPQPEPENIYSEM